MWYNGNVKMQKKPFRMRKGENSTMARKHTWCLYAYHYIKTHTLVLRKPFKITILIILR